MRMRGLMGVPMSGRLWSRVWEPLAAPRRRRARLGWVLALAAGLVPSGPLVAQVAELAPDFDGDGFADLAVGISGKRVNGNAFSGAVEILYGSASGLSSARGQRWDQDNLGLGAEAEFGDAFAEALAWGDFNDDGFSDLAVGTPFEDLVGAGGVALSNAGVVYVLYGSATGLVAAGAQRWSQDSDGVPDDSEANDSFGFALSSGDYDGDGFADLAVAAILESVRTAVGDVPQAGAVNVLYGSAAGLGSDRAQVWNQESRGLPDSAEDFSETFGRALASADFDGDGRTDLAVGVPQEQTLGRLFCPGGAVHVLYGSAAGLATARNQLWHQNRPGVSDTCEGAEGFGSALTAGDFDGDGLADLAVGVPGETLEELPGRRGQRSQGLVEVLYGGAAGLSSARAQSWTQERDGIAGYASPNDNFGSALAAGDFNGDGTFDLAVGARGDDVRLHLVDVNNAGAVNVIFGSAGGLTVTGNLRRDQGNVGIQGDLEEGDGFGGSLVAGDFDRDGRSDLAIGVTGEGLSSGTGPVPFAGAVNVIYGAPFETFSVTKNQFLAEGVLGVPGEPEENDLFGTLR